MLCVRSVLLVIASAQFGSINIDWSVDASGQTRPRLTGLEEDEEPHVGGRDITRREAIEPDDDELYELAWNRGDFEASPPEHWFGKSPETRLQRPAAVIHPVGTVYRHQVTGARGVVVGWDPVPVAPRQWIDANVPLDSRDKKARLSIPHYAVLEQVEDEHGQITVVYPLLTVVYPLPAGGGRARPDALHAALRRLRVPQAARAADLPRARVARRRAAAPGHRQVLPRLQTDRGLPAERRAAR